MIAELSATEYPPNHEVTEADGSVTLVRYRWERKVSERENYREHELAYANILRLLRDEPMSTNDLRNAALFDLTTIAWVCMNMEGYGDIVKRDGKWRVAS